MKADQKQALSAILSIHTKRGEAILAQEAEAQALRQAFEDQFKRLRKDVIRPALEEFTEPLIAQGHKATIDERDEPSSIMLSVFLRPLPSKDKNRPGIPDIRGSQIAISFVSETSRQKILVRLTTPKSRDGQHKEYDADEITTDLVTNYALQVLDAGFNEFCTPTAKAP